MATVMVKKGKIKLVVATVLAVVLALVVVRGYFVFFQPQSYQYMGVCISSQPGYSISETRDGTSVMYGVVKFSSQRGVIHIGEDFDRIHYESFHYHKIIGGSASAPPIHVLAGSEEELKHVASMIHPCGKNLQ